MKYLLQYHSFINKCNILFNQRFLFCTFEALRRVCFKRKANLHLPAFSLCSNHFFTSTNNRNFDSNTFENVSNETLDSLTERLEDIIEENGDFNSDVVYSDGVLTLNLGRGGIYVINKQSPNLQIWLSSPISGPKRYDYKNSSWIYKHDGITLHELLSKELSVFFNEEIDLESCTYGKETV